MLRGRASAPRPTPPRGGRPRGTADVAPRAPPPAPPPPPDSSGACASKQWSSLHAVPQRSGMRRGWSAGGMVAWWRGRALVSRARRCSRRCTVGAGVTCRRCQCKCKRAPPPGAGSAARALRGGSERHLQVRARPRRRERGRHAGADELVVQRRADQDDRKAEHLPAPGASVLPMQLDGTSLALGCRPAVGTAYRGEPEPYAGQGT